MFYEIEKSERVKRYLVEWVSAFGFRDSVTVSGEMRLDQKIKELKKHSAMGVKVTQTQDAIEDLVYKATNSCPRCGGYEIESDGVNFQDDCIVADMGCNTCENEWRITYEAKGVQEK